MNHTEYKHERFLRLREASRLPRRFWDHRLDVPAADKRSQEALTVVADYMRDIKEHARAGRGLLLIGPPGRGKTSTAAAVLEEAMRRGASSLYLPMAAYQDALHRSMDKEEAAQEMMDRVLGVKFLLLDDVGKEHAGGSGYIGNRLEYVIRSRFDAERPTIVTSNVRFDAWRSTYGESLHSVAHEAFLMVGLIGPDWRIRGQHAEG